MSMHSGEPIWCRYIRDVVKVGKPLKDLRCGYKCQHLSLSIVNCHLLVIISFGGDHLILTAGVQQESLKPIRLGITIYRVNTIKYSHSSTLSYSSIFH